MSADIVKNTLPQTQVDSWVQMAKASVESHPVKSNVHWTSPQQSNVDALIKSLTANEVQRR